MRAVRAPAQPRTRKGFHPRPGRKRVHLPRQKLRLRRVVLADGNAQRLLIHVLASRNAHYSTTRGMRQTKKFHPAFDFKIENVCYNMDKNKCSISFKRGLFHAGRKRFAG